MGRDSKIEWTDHTWNPFYGCPNDGQRSEGCTNCYARVWAKKFGMVNFDNEIKRASEKTFKAPLNREKYQPGDRVFVCSLSDICHPAVPDKLLRSVMSIICMRNDLTWMFLTKRPEGFARLLACWNEIKFGCQDLRRNWWFGVTAENQEQANRRISELLKIPAVVRFVSVEPMLGPIYFEHLRGIDWVICGCESLPNKRAGRECRLDWIRAVRDKCIEEGVPFFLKQMAETSGGGSAKSSRTPNSKIKKMPKLDGRVWDEIPGGIG